MKDIRLFVFICLGLGLVFSPAQRIWAKAPTTAKIAFSSNRDGNWDIYVMDPDGNGQVRLTQHQANDYSPVWSPNGEQILFVSDRGGDDDLYVMDADGRDVRRVFRKSAHRTEPTWSPDGERIAFHAQEPRWSIQTATTNGTDVVKVVQAGSAGGNPSWSPDGKEIAFVDDVNDIRRIYIVELSSGRVRTFLSDEAPWMYTPTWSPTGNRLAFIWYRWGIGNGNAFFVAGRDESGLKQIGKSAQVSLGPAAWSPEEDRLIGTELADNGNRQIVIVNIRTGTKKQLTRQGSNITAAWFNPNNLPVAPQPHLLTTVWGKIKR